MPIVRCREKIRNERRFKGRLFRQKGLIEFTSKVSDKKKQRKKARYVTYCEANGGSPVTFRIEE